MNIFDLENHESKQSELIIMSSHDVIEIFRSLILKELKKRLIWKDQCCRGSLRFKITNIPAIVATKLFPSFTTKSTIIISDEDDLKHNFRNIGNIHRDFLTHTPEQCGNSLCLLHCDRVSMRPPAIISFSKNTLKISFWIKYIGAGGNTY